ncbi:peptide-methionine (S)-S-oxide reductase [Bowdeniella nasicola]|uniref:Peptide methionine sulfoxide reductase MsrA n=2 Tax=Bowdeniella nasicola TaxID=208480 RepID=A0A1H4A4U2_9ACTO|nr:peptide-methionine (S)-S-oxide reductase [Bowdeniella nasicola]
MLSYDHAMSNSPASQESIGLALGCFWGAQKLLDSLDGVSETTVGYMGGDASHPSYRQVCSGSTGHAETVWVTYDPEQIDVADILKVFLENHDPTQGDRQGNDVGSQYRSVVFPTTTEQAATARQLIADYEPRLAEAGYGPITTTVEEPGAHEYWLAEEEHQHYLKKNPFGYCPVHATGVTCG